MWRQVRAHRSGAALGRFLLETLSTAEWQLYGISAITFRTNLENLLRSEFSLHANLLNALDLLLVKRMRARSNELSVKSCMPQRNWGWKEEKESWCRWGERCTVFKTVQLFQLENHKPAAALVGFSNRPNIHRSSYLLFLKLHLFPLLPLLLCGHYCCAATNEMTRSVTLSKIRGDGLFWAHGCCVPCCLRASLAACSMACFSSFLINLSWAACRAISATWWNTLRPLQVVLRGQSADISYAPD